MPRAAVVLLVLAALARSAALGGFERLPGSSSPIPPGALGFEAAAIVLVAVALARGWAGAEAATLMLGVFGGALVMTTGLGGVADLSVWTWLETAAHGLAALAAATVVAGWQDHGGPAPGPGPRGLRTVSLAAGLVVALAAATAQQIVVSGTPDQASVALATTFALTRLPAAVAVLGVVAWAVSRRGAVHLRGVCLVLASEAVAMLGQTEALRELGGDLWPVLVLGAAALTLGVVVPAGVGQVTSSSA